MKVFRARFAAQGIKILCLMGLVWSGSGQATQGPAVPNGIRNAWMMDLRDQGNVELKKSGLGFVAITGATYENNQDLAVSLNSEKEIGDPQHGQLEALITQIAQKTASDLSARYPAMPRTPLIELTLKIRVKTTSP